MISVETLRVIGRWVAVAGILYVLGLQIPGLLPSPVPPVEMPGGQRTTSGVSPVLDGLFLGMDGGERVHFVVQFRRDLADSEITDLYRRLGIELDGPVPEHAYITSTRAADWTDVREGLLSSIPPAVKVFEFSPADRLSPDLRDPNDPDLLDIPDYAEIDPNTVAVFIRFFDDVPSTRQSEILINAGAIQPGPAMLTRGPTGIWAVNISVTDLQILSLRDEVRFIEPTTPPVIEDMDYAGEDVGATALDADGAGSVVAQWEACQATTKHNDLENRITAVGDKTFLCRTWRYLDLSDQPGYRIGDPIGVDLDEDGTIDKILHGEPQQETATDVWLILETHVSRAGVLHVDTAGDPTRIEQGDVYFELHTDSVTPKTVINVPVDVKDQELFRYWFGRHATLVAGIIISNSESEQPGGEPKYPGIVPAATIRSHVWTHTSPVFDYPYAVQAGARISSNSFGWALNKDIHYVHGADPYTGISAFYDEVVSGRAPGGGSSGMPARMLIVASSGNEGDEGPFWRTARITNSAKNVIAVGNVSSSHGTAGVPGSGLPAADSGRGPTRDDRLTPILSAPGTQMQCPGWVCPENPPGGITSTLPESGYGSGSGTSFSTPIVSGAAAQLTQAYSTACSVEPDPQDLRALLVHSARDLTRAYNLSSQHITDELPGPDFVFGYGLIQVDDAAELLHNTVNDGIDTGWVEHRIRIDSMSQLDNSPTGPQLRVTLAWDDPPYYAEYPPRESTGLLQNDLDLEIIDPNGNRHLPWVLDASPGNEGNPATREARGPFMYVLQEWRDHENTIEQVVVDFDPDMLGGQWTVRVRGYAMRQGPQDYTLVSKAFLAVPGTDCGNFSNGSTVRIANPVDVPETKFAWILFWVSVIVLVWLVFEAVIWLYQTLSGGSSSMAAYSGPAFLLLLLAVIFYLLVAGSFLSLAWLVLIWLAYVLWRLPWSYLAVATLLILLFVIFWLLGAQSFLILALLVLIWLAFVFWRLLWP